MGDVLSLPKAELEFFIAGSVCLVLWVSLSIRRFYQMPSHYKKSKWYMFGMVTSVLSMIIWMGGTLLQALYQLSSLFLDLSAIVFCILVICGGYGMQQALKKEPELFVNEEKKLKKKYRMLYVIGILFLIYNSALFLGTMYLRYSRTGYYL